MRKPPRGASSEMNSRTIIHSKANRQFLTELGLEIPKQVLANANEIREFFDTLDTEVTGFVSVAKLRNHLRQSWGKDGGIPNEDIERVVVLCDSNKDGYLQYQDLLPVFQSMTPAQAVIGDPAAVGFHLFCHILSGLALPRLP